MNVNMNWNRRNVVDTNRSIVVVFKYDFINNFQTNAFFLKKNDVHVTSKNKNQIFFDFDKKIIEKNNSCDDFVVINVFDVHLKFRKIIVKKTIFLFAIANFNLSCKNKIRIFEKTLNVFEKIFYNDEFFDWNLKKNRNVTNFSNRK